MKILLKDLSLEKMFTVLAEVFETEYTVENADFIIEIPRKYGSGRISGIHYPNGVELISISVNFKEDTTFIYSAHQVHPLRFIYCLENDIVHKFNNENIQHNIEQYHSAIVASKYPFGHTFTFPKNGDINVTFLEVDRKVFTAQLSDEAHDMQSDFYELFFDVYATRTIFHKGLYSLQLAQIIQDIAEFDHDDFVRTNYIGAKALEMLSFMLLQYEDDQRDAGAGKVLRKSELSAVHKAAGFINNNFSELTSIDDVAKQVYLSAAKLQEGFKLIYNCTVNEYIVNKRLETAFRLLSETDMQIGEIVADIGLSSRSYFSKIFKKKYKVSPIDLKKR